MSESHPIDVHVGKRLKLRRTILGMSQETVAKAIGVTFQQVQKYERGVNRMSSGRLHDFAKILNVPVGYFFEEAEEDQSSGKLAYAGGLSEGEAPAFEHEQLSSRETMEMMRAYYRIKDPSTRRRVFDLIKTLADAD